MEVEKEKPECFGNFPYCLIDGKEQAGLKKDWKINENCKVQDECMFSLYDKPLPHLRLYAPEAFDQI